VNRVLISSFMFLIILGCGGGGGIDISLYPVTGTVTQSGSPMAGIKVTLAARDPKSKAPLLFAVVDDEGKFEIQTSAGEKGAPIGNYKVVLSAPPAEIDYANPGDAPKPSALIPKNYQDPKASPANLEVTSSGGSIDIEVP
jgi:hypothetical protein